MNNRSKFKVATPIAALVTATVLTGVPHLAAASAASRASLPCSARVSTARPAQYSDVTIYVTTKAHAHVTTVAHYKTTNHAKSTSANASGHASVTYYISDATKGYRVVVSVISTLKGASGHCSTAFTPR